MQNSYKINDLFEWSTLNDFAELEKFLEENYVEDKDNQFRLKYTGDFLRWVLNFPGYIKDWLICVRVKSNKKIIAFISAIPIKLSINSVITNTAEINFLCVHKKLRNKKITPILIKELTWRINLSGFSQAIYTSGSLLSKPIVAYNYWSRALNIPKLYKIGLVNTDRKLTLERIIRIYSLKKDNIKAHKLTYSHIVELYKLFTSYYKEYNLHQIFTIDEFTYMMLNDNIHAYVIFSNDKITDFISFYSLSSTVISSGEELRVAQSYYFISTETNLTKLFNIALNIAKDMGFDVFNTLDIMNYSSVFNSLRFEPGDADLKYYLHNLSVDIKKNEIGKLLL